MFGVNINYENEQNTCANVVDKNQTNSHQFYMYYISNSLIFYNDNISIVFHVLQLHVVQYYTSSISSMYLYSLVLLFYVFYIWHLYPILVSSNDEPIASSTIVWYLPSSIYDIHPCKETPPWLTVWVHWGGIKMVFGEFYHQKSEKQQ